MVNLRKLRNRMKKKDLAGEYLTKAQENAIYFKDGNFPNMPLYQENDIKAAFNAGRESVVENMPELKWDQKNVEYFFASTPFGTYYTDSLNAELLFYNGQRIARYFGNVETHFSFAKRVANEDYKKRIKQALGL